MKLTRLVYIVRCTILFIRLLLFTVHILHFDQCLKDKNHTTDLNCPTAFQYQMLIIIYCYDLIVIGFITTVVIGCSKSAPQIIFIRIAVIIAEIGSLVAYYFFVLADTDHLPQLYRIMFLATITMLSIRRMAIEISDTLPPNADPVTIAAARDVIRILHYVLRYAITLAMIGVFYQVEFQSKHTNWYAMFAPGLSAMLHTAAICIRMSIKESDGRKYPKFQLGLIGTYIFLISVLLVLVVPIWREIEYKNTTRIIELLLTIALTVDSEEAIQTLAGEHTSYDFGELE